MTRNASASSRRAKNRRLKNTDSLKENEHEGTMAQGQSFIGGNRKFPSTSAPRLASTTSQSSEIVNKPRRELSVPAYPFYNYADNIPKPKVIYIRNEEVANEMVASLNGYVGNSKASSDAPTSRSTVGLDLEWPFTLERVGGAKEEGKVALVQLCDVDIILLIQVSKMDSECIWFYTRP
jgi:hypothetical protein